jgi:hypothetical protein
MAVADRVKVRSQGDFFHGSARVECESARLLAPLGQGAEQTKEAAGVGVTAELRIRQEKEQTSGREVLRRDRRH